MAELTVYRTPKTLTFSSFRVAQQMHITSFGVNQLKPQEIKTDSWRTIKLSVNKGSLFVSYGSYSSSPRLNDTRQRVEMLSPHFSGLIASYIMPAMVDTIKDFLAEHFPDASIKVLNEIEEASQLDMNFYDNEGMKDDEKLQVAKLVADINSLAFPVYSKFLNNRISDGYYYDGGLDFGPSKSHRAKTYQEFLIGVFGTYRKDLARVAVDCSIEDLLWASSFKEILDMDTIIGCLKEGQKGGRASSIRGLESLADFPKRIIKRLLLAGMESSQDFSFAEDAIEMSPWVPLEDRKLCTSWKDLHDRGMANYSYEVDGNKEIHHDKELEAFFEGADFKEYKVAPLRNAQSFIETGKAMDVCVGSKPYITRAFKGEGYCFRLDSADDKPYALVEIQKRDNQPGTWVMSQASGRSNKSLPEDFSSTIKSELSRYIKLKESGI